MAKKVFKVTMRNVAEVDRNIQRYGSRLKEVVHDVLDAQFIEMVEYAKANAIWIDRTGNARQSIDSADLSSGDVVRLYLTIGVDYGIWLEVANDGKYRILQPTWTIYEAQITRLLESLGIKLRRV